MPISGTIAKPLLLLLQAAACNLENPSDLVATLVQRFQLSAWVETEDVKEVEAKNKKVELGEKNKSKGYT